MTCGKMRNEKKRKEKKRRHFYYILSSILAYLSSADQLFEKTIWPTINSRPVSVFVIIVFCDQCESLFQVKCEDPYHSFLFFTLALSGNHFLVVFLIICSRILLRNRYSFRLLHFIVTSRCLQVIV